MNRRNLCAIAIAVVLWAAVQFDKLDDALVWASIRAGQVKGFMSDLAWKLNDSRWARLP